MSENTKVTAKQQDKKKFPTEFIDLPSQGWFYPANHPLASGQVELKYMTAREEDILTSANLIRQGKVIDTLINALLVTDVSYDDIIVGDKNAIMIAARVLGYGAEYKFIYNGKEEVVDLSKIDNKPFDESLITKGNNEFSFKLPASNNDITFKFLTHGDESKINQELEGLKKLGKEGSPELTTRLKYMVTSINGDRTTKLIREFIDEAFLARDARAFREYISKIQPDVDLTFFPESSTKSITLPIGISFFWPDVSLG
jgi:hypothetical protein